MAKKKPTKEREEPDKEPTGETNPWPYTFPLRFDETEQHLIDGLAELESRRPKPSRNQLILWFIEEGLKRRGVLPDDTPS